MTPLPASISKAGFEVTLIKRVGRVAIYRQHLPGGSSDHDAYEVILPQVRHTNHKGEPVEPYEGYPAAESWGKKGWTFTSLTKAVQKLKQLTRKASRTGTVSRKNRLDGKRRGRDAEPPMFGLTPRGLQRLHTGPADKPDSPPVELQARISFGAYSGIHNLAPNQYEPSRNER